MSRRPAPDNPNPLYQHTKTHAVPVMLTLADGSRVQGQLHLAPHLRLTDLLNRNTLDNPFLAVTEAQITLRSGEEVRYHFLTINRAMIVCCFPQEEEFRE